MLNNQSREIYIKKVINQGDFQERAGELFTTDGHPAVAGLTRELAGHREYKYMLTTKNTE